MVDGRTGRVGERAAFYAAVEHRQDQGRAAILSHHAMVLLAADQLRTPTIATLNVVVS